MVQNMHEKATSRARMRVVKTGISAAEGIARYAIT
jgi:hypothetical protein